MQMWKWVAAITPVKTCFKEFSSSPPACLFLLRCPVTLTSLYSVSVSAPATMSERRPVHRWLYYRQSLLHLLLLGWLHWPTMPDRWVMGWPHFLLLCHAWYTHCTLWINAWGFTWPAKGTLGYFLNTCISFMPICCILLGHYLTT